MHFGTLGGWEWIIILVIVIIVFGVGKLPQVGGAIGKSIREFREASGSAKDQESSASTDSASHSVGDKNKV